MIDNIKIAVGGNDHGNWVFIDVGPALFFGVLFHGRDFLVNFEHPHGKLRGP